VLQNQTDEFLMERVFDEIEPKKEECKEDHLLATVCEH
jgi:hypothetical protein